LRSSTKLRRRGSWNDLPVSVEKQKFRIMEQPPQDFIVCR
jgi:hypothetical protein